MNIVSLFAGIGGFDLAFERAGAHTMLTVEIDAKCQQVLARRFPNAERESDVKQIDKVNADVITGGFPCQDISLAGKQAGLSGAKIKALVGIRPHPRHFTPSLGHCRERRRALVVKQWT